ncbi:ABC transporter permease [Spirochaeta dissipatitropha]
MKSREFTGMSTLLRLAIKRDRLRLVFWVSGICAMVVLMLATFETALTGPEEMKAMMIMFMNNPAMRALLAPASSVSIGGFMMMRTSTLIVVIIAMFGAFTLIRHTRNNEDTGCEDYVVSTVVGRHAGLGAALLLSFITYVILSLVLSLSFLPFGESLSGSFAGGFALGSVYLAFAGVAAVSAQLNQNTRGANAMAGMAIGGFFLLASFGNMLGEVPLGSYELQAAWPVWLSPFGWYQQVHAFADNHILPLFFAPVMFGVCGLLAMYFESRRDVGDGLIPSKPGRVEAGSSLLSPLGLAWRLQRKALFTWVIVMGLIGLLFGSALGEFSHAMSELEMSAEIFQDSLGTNESFILMIIGFSASFLVFYVVQAFMRIVGEEKEGLADPVLATRVSRFSWLISHIFIFSAGTTLMLIAMGIGAGLATIGETDIRFIKLLEGSLMQAPALFAVAGFCILTFGIARKYSGILSRTALGISLLAGPFFGPMFDFPQWLLNISPFTHIPGPTESLAFFPLIIMSLVSVVLLVTGIALFNRRDVNLL